MTLNIFLSLVAFFVFGYFIYLLFYTAIKPEEKPGTPDLNSLIKEKWQNKLDERISLAQKILVENSQSLDYRFEIPKEIELLESENYLLIKGSLKDISSICDQFAIMEQLPEGFCMHFGDWRFYVMEDYEESNLALKIVVMPAYHWLFMSCKLRDSILGYDVHPYVYYYQPYTFKKVLDYGIGVEAIDICSDIDNAD